MRCNRYLYTQNLAEAWNWQMLERNKYIHTFNCSRNSNGITKKKRHYHIHQFHCCLPAFCHLFRVLLAHVKYLESPGVGFHCVNVKIYSSTSEVTRSQMDFYYLPKNTKFNFNVPFVMCFPCFLTGACIGQIAHFMDMILLFFCSSVAIAACVCAFLSYKC